MHPFCYIKQWFFNINDRISNIEKWIIIFQNVFFCILKIHRNSYIKNDFNVNNEIKILEIQLQYFKKDCLFLIFLILIKLM